jgi:nicotinamide-nucleotide amidase
MVTPGPDGALDGLVERVAEALLVRRQMMSTAESCTGGGIAAALTGLAGSSRWFERGFVTYSNDAKIESLRVQPQTLIDHGAVSEATVREMAAGALAASRAQWAVAVSGIAGPDGGTPDKPVGTVCFGWAGPGRRVRVETRVFAGDRAAVRRAAVTHALEGLLILLGTV